MINSNLIKLEIDLNAIKHNINEILKSLKHDAAIYFVLKSDADHLVAYLRTFSHKFHKTRFITPIFHSTFTIIQYN